MKITNVLKTPQVRKTGPAQEGGAKEAKELTDVVSLSSASEELTSIAMSQEPEVLDFEALKKAIASGSYKPNLDALADRMLTDPTTIDSLISE